MKEHIINHNKIFQIIKTTLEIKKVSLEHSRIIRYFLRSAALRNMQNIINSQETDRQAYRLFFEQFKRFLKEELLDKKLAKQSFPQQTFRDLASENTDITFKLEGLQEEKIIQKKENEIYLKMLTLLTGSTFDGLTISPVLQISNAVEFFLKQSDFFQTINFSTNMDAIYVSLTHADAFEMAKMWVRLNDFDLLMEENLKKINAKTRLNGKLFSSVVNKLSLNGGTDPLLNQTDLDKLLDNSDLNLEVLAQFIQVEDKSKVLTQENFDLAINLKNLLTHENIDKIEKADFEIKTLSDVISLLDKAAILTQDNFTRITNLEKADLVHLFQVFSKFSHSNILDQEHFSQFLKIYNKAKGHDQQNRISEDSTEEPSDSLLNRLCAAFLKVKVLTQTIFDKIIEFFNNKINLHHEKQAEVINNLENSRSCASIFFKGNGKNDSNKILTSISIRIPECRQVFL